MISFDPVAMVSPLAARADAINATGAPAVLVEASRGGRTASTVTGVENVSSGVAATGDQTFEVGSQSKMMTAVTILQLADEGLLNLDARISDYIPGRTAGLANGTTATIRDLLEMRSGIPSYPDAVDGSGKQLFIKFLENNPGQTFGPDQALAIARGMSADYPPGTYHYNNTNFLLLGLLIENLTGKTWADALEERIFDPAGMTSTSGNQFDADPARLSSYTRDGGSLTDVTHALWAPRGESGVVSTTSDLIAFQRALLIDRTLLSEDALDEMTSYVKLYSKIFFGLGIFEENVGGQLLQGFAGGTLGTSTATYSNVGADLIVSIAATLSDLDISGNTKSLSEILRNAAAWAPIDDDGVTGIEIASVSAAALSVGTNAHGGVHLAWGGASIDLVRGLRQLDATTTQFEDGSVLVVGDGKAGTSDDDIANVVSIPKQFRDAITCDNCLIGLGGDDRLIGGYGDDRLDGGLGRDRLAGNGGDDRLGGGRLGDVLIGGNGDDRIWGGGGWDLLFGRDGSDVLVGGNGHDTFRFAGGDSRPGAADVIRDFALADDIIDLKRVDAVEGGRNSAFHWIGDDGFSGAAGELHYVVAGGGIRVEGDTDGDGHADLEIVLNGLDGITADHFLL